MMISDKRDAERRVIVLAMAKDGTLYLNCDFENTDLTPHAVAEAIASNRYTAAEIAEVLECWPKEGRCSDITDDVYAAANHLREVAYEKAVAA